MRIAIILLALLIYAPVAAAQQNSDQSGRAVSRNQQDQWRYKYHNGRWWYWQPNNSWVIWNGNRWMPQQAFGQYRAGYRGNFSNRPGGNNGYGYNGYYGPNAGYYGPGYYGYGYGPGYSYSPGMAAAPISAAPSGAIKGRASAPPSAER